MKLPKAVLLIKVGLYDYTVKEWGHKEATTANKFGEVVYSEQVIRICTTYGYRRAAETLLHELTHCVIHEYGVNFKDKKNDDGIDILAQGLATVWRDNPSVLEWIGKGLVKDDN